MKLKLFLTGLLSLSMIAPAVAFDDDDKKTDEKSAKLTEREIRQKVTQLAQKGEIEDAIKLIDEGIENGGDQLRLHSLRYSVYTFAARAGKLQLGVEQLDKLLDYEIANISEKPTIVLGLASHARTLASAYGRSGKREKTLERLVEIQSAVNSVIDSSAPTIQNRARFDVNLAVAQQLVVAGKTEASQELLNSLTEQSQKVLSENEDKAMAYQIAGNVQVFRSRFSAEESERDEASQKLDEINQSAFEKFPKNPAVLSMYFANKSMKIGSLARSNPDEAEKLLDAATEQIEELKEDESLSRTLEMAARGMSRHRRAIESAKKIQALIGKDMIELDVEFWVNGEEISNADLKGKVVMLDFWAVWCGPCIRTFPHLRHLHEEFGEEGLEIIGVTRHYNYSWNEDQGRASRAKEIVDAEVENEMLVKFAEQHKLPYRFAVTPKGSSLQSDYAVSGIPHVVLIDREGKIAMIRVGSGDKNARDLEAKIKELIEK